LLDAEGVAFEYRDYIKEPLGADELRALFSKLGVPVGSLLRSNDKNYKALGLTSHESDEVLIAHIATYPSLMKRPIGVSGSQAVYGRPIENLLTLK